MRTRRPADGLTLIEILVVMGLVVLVGVFIVTFLSSALRTTAREGALVEMEETAFFTLRRLTEDLQSSSVGGLSYLTRTSQGPTGVAINPLEDVTAEGNLAWKSHFLLYYWLPDRRHLFRSPPLTSVGSSRPNISTPSQVRQADFRSYLGSVPQQRAPIAEGVTFFQVENAGLSGSGRELHLALELTRNVPPEGPRAFRAERVVTMRN